MEILKCRKGTQGYILATVNNNGNIEDRVIDGYALSQINLEVEERLYNRKFSSSTVIDYYNKSEVTSDGFRHFYIDSWDYCINDVPSFCVSSLEEFNYIVSMGVVSPQSVFGKDVLRIRPRGKNQGDEDQAPHVHIDSPNNQVSISLITMEELADTLKYKKKQIMSFIKKNIGFLRYMWDRLTNSEYFIDEYKDNVELQKRYLDQFAKYSPNTKLKVPSEKSEPKYKLTTRTKIHKGVTLYQIESNDDQHMSGGWIQSENNLSQEGNCWIVDTGHVYGNARVYEDAYILGGHIYGDARVYGNARVEDDTQIYGNAQVYGHAQIIENVKIYGTAQVYGDAVISGEAQIYGDAVIAGRTIVAGKTKVFNREDY